MSGSIGDALVLGLLQGVTWILPVSASAHSALARLLFGVGPAPATLVFTVQVGILAATALALRGRLREMGAECLRALETPRRLVSSPGGRDVLAVVLATFPTALFAVALSEVVAPWRSSPLALGIGLALTVLVLLSTQWVGRGQIELPGWSTVLLIGMGQGLAFSPGVSRSAVTIAIALWLGLRRDRAFELSMLLSLSLLAGVALLHLREVLGSSPGWSAALLGGTAAFLGTSLSLGLLRRAVMSPWFPWFALWVGPLAIATLAMARVWPGR